MAKDSRRETSSESVQIPFPEDEPVVEMWPTAARPFKIGRSRSYQLAESGRFPVPVQRIGGRWMVLTVDLRHALGLQIYKRASSSEPPAA